LGRRATQRLLELMNAGPFRMTRRGGRDEDRYGRKLRVIERAGRSVGAILVAEGLARPWDCARRSWCASRSTENQPERSSLGGAWPVVSSGRIAARDGAPAS
jgi:endonuclease YncB( thermonuclease family)